MILRGPFFHHYSGIKYQASKATSWVSNKYESETCCTTTHSRSSSGLAFKCVPEKCNNCYHRVVDKLLLLLEKTFKSFPLIKPQFWQEQNKSGQQSNVISVCKHILWHVLQPRVKSSGVCVSHGRSFLQAAKLFGDAIRKLYFATPGI